MALAALVFERPCLNFLENQRAGLGFVLPFHTPKCNSFPAFLELFPLHPLDFIPLGSYRSIVMLR